MGRLIEANTVNNNKNNNMDKGSKVKDKDSNNNRHLADILEVDLLTVMDKVPDNLEAPHLALGNNR